MSAESTSTPAGAGDSGATSEEDDGRTFDTSFPVVGVGASAGGLEAFTLLLKHLAPDTGMAFVLLQHLDPTHSSRLAEALAAATVMPVRAIDDRVRIEPNHVYVLRPNVEVGIGGGRLTLTSRIDTAGKPHHPIDAFFRALAKDRGNAAIGVVLSGTASDGTDGLRAIKEADGITLAQEPQTAKFDGMPRNAVAAGVVDFCAPVEELAQELGRLSRHPYVAAAKPRPPKNDTSLGEILAIVRAAFGVDFTEYKAPSFERRLARRMALRRVETLPSYLGLLTMEPEEVRHLYEDLLIHVTSFFRDAEQFDHLKHVVFPQITKDRAATAPIRCWIAGCSTGEEVYSLAIALLEHLGEAHHPIQIFGTDVSARAVEKARAGMYTDAEMAGVSDERRRRFFTMIEGRYCILKSVRELCVFVQHDLARDPPFSRLDLVSCRNVLIYFGPALQKRVLFTLHYALREPGFLVLGRSESASGFGQLFTPTDKLHRIFARTALPSKLRFAPRSEARGEGAPGSRAAAYQRPSPDPAGLLDRMLLARYAPPGVLINDRMEILQFFGETGAFLQAAPGEPQNNLIKMARGGLVAILHTTLARAKKSKAAAVTEGVLVEQDGFSRTCDVAVLPFTAGPEAKDPLYVVVFEQASRPSAKRAASTTTKRGAGRAAELAEIERVAQLKHELATTKQYLEAMIHEHGDTTDELGSANEELVSGNEELQSLNEELETAKEELQSINEELTTVNDELHSRNQEVTRVNSDLLNLLGTVEIPVVILDMQRRIRRFTPHAQLILNVIPSDVGRPFSDIRSNLQVADLDADIAGVIARATAHEAEVQDRAGRWHRLQIRPYRTVDGAVDGAILSLVDIDALKRNVSQATAAATTAERANHAKDEFLAVLSHELRAPLSSMLLYAQLVRAGELEGARLQRAGEAIERGVNLQVRLIEDLLDVSRIVTGKLLMERMPVDLATVVEAALESVRAPAEAKAMVIEMHVDPAVGRIYGSPARLQQVVTNLLQNAIKFTLRGGRITLALEKAGTHARISVADTGMGIEPEFLPHVFGRFTQEDSSITRKHGGLGLGLALVHHLVALHGGTVHAASPGVGKGSTFTVSIPLLQERMPAPVPPLALHDDVDMSGAPSAELRGVRVLVVDDDPATGAAVAEVLRLSGAHTRVADSAETGLQAIAEFKPQVLVSDIAMPGEDGYVFIERVRALGPAEGGSLPALALTALASEDDAKRALAAGFNMHVAKPVDIAHLQRSVVELSRQRPSNARA